MHRAHVYVDSSVFGGVRDKEFPEASNRFFDLVRKGKYLVLVSEVTLAELSSAPPDVRNVYSQLPDECVEGILVGPEVNELTQAYIDAQVVGASQRADAAYVAAATIARPDLLLSWNFKHLVNYSRIRRFNGVNALNGYPQIEIRSPLEIGDEDEDV